MSSESDLDLEVSDIGVDSILDAAGLDGTAQIIAAKAQSSRPAASRPSDPPVFDIHLGDLPGDDEDEASLSGLDQQFFGDDELWEVPRAGELSSRANGLARVGSAVDVRAHARASAAPRHSATEPAHEAASLHLSQLPHFDVELPEEDDSAGEAAFDATVAGFGRVPTSGGGRRRETDAVTTTRRPVMLRPSSRSSTDSGEGADGAVLGRARVATRIVRREGSADGERDPATSDETVALHLVDADLREDRDETAAAVDEAPEGGPRMGAAALMAWARPRGGDSST
ncbi:MAG: hypothetical protein H6698_08845 [Myxococcales bacterium]|nr:hypothetical protein [Myxococcales bacterium]MCB9534392.1 hypothetical protein [Myxococcales bacterium]